MRSTMFLTTNYKWNFVFSNKDVEDRKEEKSSEELESPEFRFQQDMNSSPIRSLRRNLFGTQECEVMRKPVVPDSR